MSLNYWSELTFVCERDTQHVIDFIDTQARLDQPPARYEQRQQWLRFLKPLFDLIEQGVYLMCARYIHCSDGVIKEEYEFFNATTRLLDTAVTLQTGPIVIEQIKHLPTKQLLQTVRTYAKAASLCRNVATVNTVEGVLKSIIVSKMIKKYHNFAGAQDGENPECGLILNFIHHQLHEHYNVRIDTCVGIPVLQLGQEQGLMQ